MVVDRRELIFPEEQDITAFFHQSCGLRYTRLVNDPPNHDETPPRQPYGFRTCALENNRFTPSKPQCLHIGEPIDTFNETHVEIIINTGEPKSHAMHTDCQNKQLSN